jgi:hypothetical protein
MELSEFESWHVGLGHNIEFVLNTKHLEPRESA